MSIASGLNRVWKALTGGASRIGIGVRFALSQGQPGVWASDHREEANHFTGWNFVAIRAIALQAAQADLSIFDDSQDTLGTAKAIRKSRRNRGLLKAYGDETQDAPPLSTNHRYMRLMKRPNPTQSGASQRYEQVVQLLLTGTALTWLVRNANGLTVERYVIPTAVAMPMPPSREMPRGGWRVDPASSRWQLRDAQGYVETAGWQRAIGQPIPAENMLVVRWPHPIWKDDGYSALAAGALMIDAAEQVDKARFSSMLNGADPSVFVAPPDDMDLTQEQLDAAILKFEQKYCGASKSKKAMFVPKGTMVTPVTTNAKDMDYVLAFTQFRDAIMALHGVPGIAAGITDGGSYAALYASLKQFSMLTVQPVLSLIAEEETEQQSPEFGESLTVELTAAAIDDPEVEERQLQTDLQAGIRTKGELRSLRGLPPFGDARDDQIAGADRTVALGTLRTPAAADETTTGVAGVPLPGGSEPMATATPGATGDAALPENITTSETLNGAQITAAIAVVAGVTAGTTADVVAIELLLALGIEEERARRMVAASKTVAQPQANGFKSNGHRPSAVEKTLAAAVQATLADVETSEEAKAILRGVGRYP